MKRFAAVLTVLTVLGCEKPVAPDIISRPLGGSGSPEQSDGSTQWTDGVDANGFELDAGACCLVGFAVRAEAGDVNASLMVEGLRYGLTLLDGGAGWGRTLCLQSSAEFAYWYEVSASSPEDDAGLFVFTRVNLVAPIETGGFPSQSNRFIGAEDCQSLGVHGSLTESVSDAGTVDAGEVDAGAVDAGEYDAGAADAGQDAGVDAGTVDAGSTVDAGISVTCADFCRVEQMVCAGPPKTYASLNNCLSFCDLWALGIDGDSTGDTLACRVTYQNQAVSGDPALECPNTSASGGASCH